MISWPFCPLHNRAMDLVCLNGTWQYVCPVCQERPLMYSTKTKTEGFGRRDGWDATD